MRLCEVDVIFNAGELMCRGYGNTRKQAERNASINGLAWMRKKGILSEQDVSCSGRAVNQNIGGFSCMKYGSRDVEMEEEHKE